MYFCSILVILKWKILHFSDTIMEYGSFWCGTKMLKRSLDFSLPVGQSAFIWGARNTGKSTFLKAHFPHSIYYDFLKSEVVNRYLTQPERFREEVLALPDEGLALPIIVDEIQKVPALLNEVHWLIENTSAYFILCGSSARTLRRQGVNLLGGRAWRFNFYPLTTPEIPEFDLVRAMNHGLIPSHYLQNSPKRSLRAYVSDYLREEIQQEGLVRNLPAFSRFLDAISFTHGELTNYNNIARDCGINNKTVKEYYQILIDTLIGYYVFPYRKHVKREILIATPKFYLFDMGIANFLQSRTISELKGIEAGDAFEHFIMLEIMAYRGLKELDFDICYWRTKTNLEVDFILGPGKVAIEAKLSKQVSKEDLRGLFAFCEEHNPTSAIVVSQDPVARKWTTKDDGTIWVLPWQDFLQQLWSGELI